jgi:hypothetical protein
MSDSCIMVYTSRSKDEMLAAGGSAAWKLGARARQCRYLVCTWNPGGEHAQPRTELSHREAFLVGLISSIESAPLPDDPGRSIIRFSQFALLRKPNVWNGHRNPVAYTSLHELGIDPDTLKFEPVPPASVAPSVPSPVVQFSTPLTIAQAKEALATTYGVSPQAIEITIRG